MTDPGYSVLLVDADADVRSRLAKQLSPLGCEVLQAADGDSAMRVMRETDVRVLVSELYLTTAEQQCLILAMRRVKALRGTRTLAHTRFGTKPDRDWAMHSGADAFLIKPTRAARLRYVVSRLATATPRAATQPRGDIVRRDSLDAALVDIESGAMPGISSIIFSREWWAALPKALRSRYRTRARAAHVSLRSDSLLSNHFVEVRGPSRTDQGLSSERPESPYRR